MNATKFVRAGIRHGRLWNLARCSAFPSGSKFQAFRSLSTTRPAAFAASNIPETLAAADEGGFSLFEKTPLIIELTQILLEKVHDGSMLGTMAPDGLAWWAAIAGTTIAARLLIVTPLSIYQQRLIKRQNELRQVMEAWQPALRSSLMMKLKEQKKKLSEEEFLKQLNKAVMKKQSKVMMKQGCHPFFSILLSMTQIPIWVSLSVALRHLCGAAVPFFDGPHTSFVPAQGMSSEGILWFNDLLLTDSTMALPLTVFAVQMGNVLLMHWRIRRQIMVGRVNSMPLLLRAVTGISYVVPFYILLISFYQPAALVFYWALSASFGLIQNLIFQITWVRKALGFHIPTTKDEILNRLL
ncbi:Cytochrome c oxidase assembly protein cox18, mitochondrial [Coemansia sp. RSA 1250]|nr:Cytochrome c oxidase assembly protein cox18, mitochondrial [Coemansia sp. RSA 1250]